MKNTKTELERISDKFGTKNTKKNGLALTSDKLGKSTDFKSSRIYSLTDRTELS